MTKYFKRGGLLTILVLLLAAGLWWWLYSDREIPVVGCSTSNGIEPFCNLHRPEDMAALPGGRYVLISQMGDFVAGTPGSIALFDQDTGNVESLYPVAVAKQPNNPLRGSLGCSEPGARLSPHGIDLSPGDGDSHVLLVVNHGGRESVEFFRLSTRATDKGGMPWQLSWLHCVEAPADSFLNDVVALPDGGFAVTNMMPKNAGMLRVTTSMLLGRSTGHVWQWQPKRGFTEIPGSRGTLPNGVALSADGRILYINYTGNNMVRKLERHSGRVLAEVPVKSPDNSTWSRDGKLLVASLQASMIDFLRPCGLEDIRPCGLPFKIVAVDPVSMSSEVIFAHSGAPMGMATVALDTDRGLLMGSFVGDRLIRVVLP